MAQLPYLYLLLLFKYSYSSHGFTTSFLGFSQPIYFLFTSYYSCRPTSHYSCHSGLLGLFYYFFLSLFSYCWASSAIGGPLLKVGINIQTPEHISCSYNSYANTYIIIFSAGFFLNSGLCLISFLAINRLVSSNFLV